MAALPAPLLALPGIEGSLERVEKALAASVISDDPFLTEVAGHLIGAGGKRVRPALAVVAASVATGGDTRDLPDEVIQGAISVELVHLGSLYHDDVMDEATTRRSVESVNARWGNLVAILAGDFLLARSSEIASALGSEVAGLLAATISRLCEGQVAELQHAYGLDRSLEAYNRSISGKTAALLATSCRIGALVADLPRPQVEALTLFGDRFGMAFQVVDDVLDIVASDDELGKPSGNDMAEGVYTLPVISTLAGGGPAADELRSILGSPLDRPAAEQARDIIRLQPAVTEACDVARRYVDDAIAALEPLPPGPNVEALTALAHHTVDRVTSRA
ncbi:MAG TPA: polyprenyl synthetase family protein [Acidimicrobiales bacterium]